MARLPTLRGSIGVMKIAFFIHHEWTGDKFAFYGETLPSPLPGDVEFELDWDFDHDWLVERLTMQAAARGFVVPEFELEFQCFNVQGEEWDDPEVRAAWLSEQNEKLDRELSQYSPAPHPDDLF